MEMFQIMEALKPEPFRPSDARSGRFLLKSWFSFWVLDFVIWNSRRSLAGLSFLFASFSLDSKEKEEKKGLRLRQKPTVCDLSSTLVFPILHRLWIRSITATNVRTDPHILGMNRKTVTFERFRASND